MENIENQQIKDKLDSFERKVQDSDNPELFWNEAINLAKEEESLGGNDKYYADIGIDEIVTFGESIKKLETIEDKYKLMMQKTEKGKLWYDVLLGDSNSVVFSVVAQAIELETNEYGRFKNVVDVGTGTGNTLRTVAPYCDHVYGIDFSDFSLDVAQKRGLPSNASIVRGSAEHLPFRDRSTDLIVSNGLIYYLSGDETKNFVQEISRILKFGGKYYYSTPMKDDGEVVPRISSEVLESAKAALMDVVSRMASEGGNPNTLGLKAYNDLLLDNNLDITNTFQEENNNIFLIEYTRSGRLP